MSPVLLFCLIIFALRPTFLLPIVKFVTQFKLGINGYKFAIFPLTVIVCMLHLFTNLISLEQHMQTKTESDWMHDTSGDVRAKWEEQMIKNTRNVAMDLCAVLLVFQVSYTSSHYESVVEHENKQ